MSAQGYTHIVSARTQAEMDDRMAVPLPLEGMAGIRLKVVRTGD